MPDAVRAADVNRLGDRLGPVGLSGVNRDVDVVVAHQLKRGAMVLGGVVVLGAREIEPDDAAPLVRDRQLRHLERALGRDVANAAQDDRRLDAVRLLRGAQPLQHRLDDARQLQAAPRVEHRRVAHLHVPHVLLRRVLGELVRDARQRVGGLHHAQRHVERLQILDERAAVLAEVHLTAQAIGVLRGQLDALPLGEVEDGREAKRAVQVDVQIGLRETLDDFEGDRGGRHEAR